MKHVFVKSILTFAMLPLATQSVFAEGSPWLAEPGATSITISQVHQSSDEIKKLPVEIKLKQDTTWLSISHSLNDDFAFDFKTGYAESEEESGLTDTSIGLNWRLIDEFIEDSLPTTTLRAGLIAEGGYDIGSPHAIGDGANGVELSLLTGKVIQPWLAVSAELGFRKRSSGVPDDIFYSASVHFLPAKGLTTSLSYQITDAKDGLTIGEPGFDGTNFHRLEEDVERFDISASYSFDSAYSIGANYYHVVDGKNTANIDAYALSLGYAF